MERVFFWEDRTDVLSKDSPHAAPELLTSTCKPPSPSRLVSSATRDLHASRD